MHNKITFAAEADNRSVGRCNAERFIERKQRKSLQFSRMSVNGAREPDRSTERHTVGRWRKSR
jgi:hypothetical protein